MRVSSIPDLHLPSALIQIEMKFIRKARSSLIKMHITKNTLERVLVGNFQKFVQINLYSRYQIILYNIKIMMLTVLIKIKVS